MIYYQNNLPLLALDEGETNVHNDGEEKGVAPGHSNGTSFMPSIKTVKKAVVGIFVVTIVAGAYVFTKYGGGDVRDLAQDGNQCAEDDECADGEQCVIIGGKGPYLKCYTESQIETANKEGAIYDEANKNN